MLGHVVERRSELRGLGLRNETLHEWRDEAALDQWIDRIMDDIHVRRASNGAS